MGKKKGKSKKPKTSYIHNLNPMVEVTKRKKGDSSSMVAPMLMLMDVTNDGSSGNKQGMSSRTKMMMIVMLLLFIGGGIAIWYFFIRKEPVAKAAYQSAGDNMYNGANLHLINGIDPDDPKNVRFNKQDRKNCCIDGCAKMCELEKEKKLKDVDADADSDVKEYKLCDKREGQDDAKLTNCIFHCSKLPAAKSRKYGRTLLELGPNFGKEKLTKEEEKLKTCGEYNDYNYVYDVQTKLINCASGSKTCGGGMKDKDKDSTFTQELSYDHFFDSDKPKIFLTVNSLKASGDIIDFTLEESKDTTSLTSKVDIKKKKGCIIDKFGYTRFALEETNDHEVGVTPEIKGLKSGTSSIDVKFAEEFYEKPTIILSVTSLSAKNTVDISFKVEADSITTKGFNFKVTTKGEIDRIQCNWLAHIYTEIEDLHPDEITSGISMMEAGNTTIPKEIKGTVGKPITVNKTQKINFFSDFKDILGTDYKMGTLSDPAIVIGINELEAPKGVVDFETKVKSVGSTMTDFNIEAKSEGTVKKLGICWVGLSADKRMSILG